MVEILIKYLAVSGDEGQHEFLIDKRNRGLSCTSLLTGMGFCRIKACTMADGNYGVCLEMSRKYFLY
jgi:hypothetical protein